MKGLRGRSPLALAIVTLLAILATSVLGGSPVAALAAASAEDDPVPVILIGAPGLTFSDLDAEHSPTLVDLAQRGATASMTVLHRVVLPLGSREPGEDDEHLPDPHPLPQVVAADPQGRVREVTTPTRASTPCPVLIVDAGTLSADSVARAGALAGLDALVAGFVDDYPDADVIVAGVGDVATTTAGGDQADGHE